MSEPIDDAPIAKPKRSLVKKLVILLILLGLGGGVAFGMMRAGILGHQDSEPVDRQPKLVLKGSDDPYAPKAAEGEAAEASGDGEAEGGGSPYRIAYYNFTEEFTSNLRDSDGLVQLSLAASTRRDGRVLMWLKKHELAIRSAVLVVLADTPETDVSSPEGKVHLQRRLTDAMNKVLIANEGFGGVDAVYFKSFLVQ